MFRGLRNTVKKAVSRRESSRGAASVSLAPVAQAVTKKVRFNSAPVVDNNPKSFSKKRGKDITQMTDAEFEAFAANMPDDAYWEAQSRRGFYPPDDTTGDNYDSQADEYEEDF